MKYFVARLLASISSTHFYEQVLREPFKKPLTFYIQFLLLTAAVMTIRYWVATIPFVEKQVATVKSEAIQNYPSDFLVTWNGEHLAPSSALEIDFPAKTPVSVKELADKLAVIQPNEDTTNQSVLLAVTPTKLRLLDEGSVVQEESLAPFLGEEQFILTKESLPALASRVESWINSNAVVIGFIYPLAIFLFLIVSRAYLLLIESGIIFLFLRIGQSNLRFGKLFQLVMALFVPAEIINQIASMVGLHVNTSILSLSFWIFFVFVFFSISKKPA
jgi:hypothetical protein